MVYVVGHRGAAGVKPENTLAGFRYAEEREHDEIPPAKLTPLGRKLVGLDPWHKKENSYVHPMSARRRQRRRLRG